MSQRLFPSPWSIEDIDGCFVVKASNDRPLIFIYYGEGIGRRSLARLLTRDAAAAASIGDLEAEHQEGSKRLRRVAQTVEAVLNDQDLSRNAVSNVIHDFIDRERQHMMMEESTVFPAALKALRPSDWAEIALKLADREDPLSQPGLEQKFNALRRKILELGEEAETARRVAGSQKE